MPSEAAATLAKTELFLDQAERLAADNAQAFAANLEAAIVFARSITFHIQKQFAGHPKFAAWYGTWQNRLKQDPLSAFLLDQRNFVLKEGSAPIRKQVSIALSSSIGVSISLSIKITYAKPWYKRSPVTWVQHLMLHLRQGWNRWKESRERVARRRQAVAAQEPVVVTTFYFDDERWRDKPAVSLVRTQCSLLQELVSDAERTFA